MVELIAMLTIVGILAAVAVPRFFERNLFDSRGFRDQLVSTLRFAQKTAVAQHRFVCVAFTTNRSVKLTQGIAPGCGGDLVNPSTGATSYTVTSPTSDVTMSGYAPFNFNALGQPSAAQAITVSGIAAAIVVEADTGYVH